MLDKKISPSMMCAGLDRLGDTLSCFEKSGIEYLHIDVMDGHFVPNFTLGTDYCKNIRKLTSIPLDIHLMIEKPEDKLSWFDIRENDIVSVHSESTAHISKALQYIRDRGALVFAAVNPGTGLSALTELLCDIDGVLVMTVNPGFAGQKMTPGSLDKISRVRRFLDENGREDCMLEVDGNVSFENAALMSRAGADVFVAGTSSVFKSGLSLSEGISKLKEAVE